jgi:hypothetical protein
VAVRHAADAAHRQRATHRLADEVGQRRRHQALRQRGLQQRVPAHAGVDLDPVGAEVVKGLQAAEVDHQAGPHLRLPEGRVPAPAAGDADAVAIGELQQAHHILHRAGLEHGQRHLVHDLAEILRVLVARGRVQQQAAVQRRQAVKGTLRFGRRFSRRRGHPAAGQCVEAEHGSAGAQGGLDQAAA